MLATTTALTPSQLAAGAETSRQPSAAESARSAELQWMFETKEEFPQQVRRMEPKKQKNIKSNEKVSEMVKMNELGKYDRNSWNLN